MNTLGEYIEIIGAREHNLQNVSVQIPQKKITVVTGVSGSGKTSLIMDTLKKESMRQFWNCFDDTDKVYEKPNVDVVYGLTPVVSVSQTRTNNNPRSTVGTITEIHKMLRALYSNYGEIKCTNCGHWNQSKLIANLTYEYNSDDDEDDTNLDVHACADCGSHLMNYGMTDFSPNTKRGMCRECQGLGMIYELTEEALIHPEKSIIEGAIDCWWNNDINTFSAIIRKAAEHYSFEFDEKTAFKDLSVMCQNYILYGAYDSHFTQFAKDTEPPKSQSKGLLAQGVLKMIYNNYVGNLNKNDFVERYRKYFKEATCKSCNGSRLSSHTNNVRVAGRTLQEVLLLPLTALYDWVITITMHGNNKEFIKDLSKRIKNIIDLGLGYLTLSRSVISLSGGEMQRLRISQLLSSSLSNITYIFDEPTIGLHQSDSRRIINAARCLVDKDNTVIIIEHDVEVIKAADYIVEVGPGAGKNGGRILFQGNAKDIVNCSESIIKDYFVSRNHYYNNDTFKSDDYISILKADKNNLKAIDVDIPLKQMTSISGVSGSGKSTLAFAILHAELQNWTAFRIIPRYLKGYENISSVVSFVNTSAYRSLRSNIMTYIGVNSDIRAIFANLDEAKEKRITKEHFSTNVSGGRCDLCQGLGYIESQIMYMADEHVTCPMCKGKKYKKNVLQIKYKDKNISDVMSLSIAEAIDFFEDHKAIKRKLEPVLEIGLGYLSLGHPLKMLSGGEYQRIKLAKNLLEKKNCDTVYILDEPTTGLHPKDVENLIAILRKIVQKGNTVIVVEHNLDLIMSSDYVIDLGIYGGENGGELLYQGKVDNLHSVSLSITGSVINDIIKNNRF